MTWNTIILMAATLATAAKCLYQFTINQTSEHGLMTRESTSNVRDTPLKKDIKATSAGKSVPRRGYHVLFQDLTKCRK